MMKRTVWLPPVQVIQNVMDKRFDFNWRPQNLVDQQSVGLQLKSHRMEAFHALTGLENICVGQADEGGLCGHCFLLILCAATHISCLWLGFTILLTHALPLFRCWMGPNIFLTPTVDVAFGVPPLSPAPVDMEGIG